MPRDFETISNLDSIWWRWISAEDQQKIYIKWNETPHKFSDPFLAIAFFSFLFPYPFHIQKS